MCETMIVKSGQKLQKWLNTKVERGTAGYDEVAGKLGCIPERDALKNALHHIFASESRADDVMKSLDKNQKMILRKRETLMKRAQKRKHEENTTQVESPKIICEREIQSTKQQIESEAGILKECEERFERIKNGAASQRNVANQLMNQVRNLLDSVNKLETEARECQEEINKHQDNLLTLNEQLASLNEQLLEANAIHYCIGQPIDGCTLIEEAQMLAETGEINKWLLKIMTAPTEFPTDFQECLGMATLPQVRLIAQIMALTQKLTAEGQKIYWHFQKGDDVATFLEFAGYNVVEEEQAE